MRRLFWLGVGIAVGAVAARRVSRTVRAYSPGGLAGSARESAVGLLDSVRDFVADVREGMAEREAEIQDALARGVTLDELAEHGLTADDLAADDLTASGLAEDDLLEDLADDEDVLGEEAGGGARPDAARRGPSRNGPAAGPDGPDRRRENGAEVAR